MTSLATIAGNTLLPKAMPTVSRNDDPAPQTGHVSLVGAGPGDPGMLTLRGRECLANADVVLYDYLVNRRILDYARADAELICLGSHAEGRVKTQDEINRMMVDFADQAKWVVRLKGGDPAVFARGAEEAEVLSQRSIPFEIVPGITAALAAGSCAGIPITHRDLSSAVALVTGHEKAGKQDAGLNYAQLANFPGTLVIYMGTTTVSTWTAGLIDGGKSPTTPVAVLRRCSLPDQSLRMTTLGELTELVEEKPKIRPPVIFIIGEVVELSDQLNWFQRRPLFGRNVLLTRPLQQGLAAIPLFEQAGAAVDLFPAIEISAAENSAPLDEAITHLRAFDWLTFSSANGVDYFFRRLESLGYDARLLGQTRIAAIGPATASRLSDYRLRADLIPPRYDADSLAETLGADAQGKRFLLVRASRGRDVIAQELQSAGGQVVEVVAYQSRDALEAPSEIRDKVERGAFDWITVTSSAIARSLATIFGQTLENCKLASISPITSATLRELGHFPTVEASEYTLPGLKAAIVEAESNGTVETS